MIEQENQPLSHLGLHGQALTVIQPNIVRGSEGYTTILSNKSIQEGSFYFEVIPLALPQNTNIRIGIASKTLPNVLESPVGTLKQSYGYRISDGHMQYTKNKIILQKRFNDRHERAFGPSTNVNDVLGVFVHLGNLDPPIQPQHQQSFIAYFINGVFLGIAFENIHPQQYCAAVSFYGVAEASIELSNCKYNYEQLFPKSIGELSPLLKHSNSFSRVSEQQVELNYSYFQ